MNSFLKSFMRCGALVSLGQGRILLGFGKATWMSAPQEKKRPAFYFPDFFLKSASPWVQFEAAFETTRSALLEQLAECSTATLEGTFILPPSEPFRDAFTDLKRRFEEGTLEKAVPYLIARAEERMTQEKLAALLRRLLVAEAHLYGFWNEELGMLGATPELLFSLKERERPLLKTCALAGTLGEHATEEAFLQDPKELHEHRLVCLGIQRSLERFGKVRTGTLRLEPYGKLMHLMTPLELELEEPQPIEELITALHPTPALGGFPTEEALSWLAEYAKKMPRSRYGAPVGVLRGGGGEMRCFVAIRGVQWNANGLHLGAGCGVVAESILEHELKEIERKMQATCHLLGMDYAVA